MFFFLCWDRWAFVFFNICVHGLFFGVSCGSPAMGEVKLLFSSFWTGFFQLGTYVVFPGCPRPDFVGICRWVVPRIVSDWSHRSSWINSSVLFLFWRCFRVFTNVWWSFYGSAVLTWWWSFLLCGMIFFLGFWLWWLFDGGYTGSCPFDTLHLFSCCLNLLCVSTWLIMSHLHILKVMANPSWFLCQVTMCFVILRLVYSVVILVLIWLFTCRTWVFLVSGHIGVFVILFGCYFLLCWGPEFLFAWSFFTWRDLFVEFCYCITSSFAFAPDWFMTILVVLKVVLNLFESGWFSGKLCKLLLDDAMSRSCLLLLLAWLFLWPPM